MKKNEYNKMIGRIAGATSVLCLSVCMLCVAIYDEQKTKQTEVVKTVNVNGRSFDTITMDQYDKMVDYVYKFAGDEDFAVQYAVSECLLNDIERTNSENKIDTYLDRLYKKRADHFTQSEFEDETEDVQDAIREAVQSALDERTMPSGVTAMIYSGESRPVVYYERYEQPYLTDSYVRFYYQK